MSRSQPFGHYDLLDRINVGGMAEVFRARERETGAICAVKRILPEVAEDEEFVRMFRDEARLARLLDHPNICRILDLGRIDSTYFLALQYVDGHDLRTLFDRLSSQKQQAPLGFLAHVFTRTCEGLDYAHKKRDPNGRPLHLVHRDVSPQNILVGYDGDVKLIDFGIAKSAMKLSKTQVGTIKGKYAYMSPEQVRGLPLDHRSDIFSLGICMWELLTAKRLFASDNEMLIMERVKDAEMVLPRKVNPIIPLELERIVMKALSRDVDDRYPSASDLKADLQAFAYAADLKWSREEVGAYMRRAFSDEPAEANGASAGASASTPNPSTANDPAKEGAMNGNSTQLPTKAIAPSGPQEQLMAENKGSDLDVFEGLVSKPTSSRKPNASAAPPPPPPTSTRSVPPPPPPPRRTASTQMGIGLPLPGQSTPPLTPPPRTSTPPIAPPPSRSPLSVAPQRSNAPPAPTAPGHASPAPANARGAMVDMDWDDEDEKTHVYDKDVVGREMMKQSGAPAPMPTPRPPPPPSGGVNLKSTMLGMAPALPPPPSRGPTGSERPLPPPPSKPPSRSNMPSSTPFNSPGNHGNLASTQIATHTPLPMPAPPPGGPSSFPSTLASTASFPHPSAPPMNSAPPMGSTQPSAPPVPVSGPQYVPQIQPAVRERIADNTQIIRQKEKGSGALWIGALFIAGAAAVGAYLWASNRPGNILVQVDLKAPKGTEVIVSVDGAEKCRDTSCRVEVKPGAHAIKVVAGDATSQKAVTVEPGKDLVVPLSIEVAPKQTVLKIASTQSGVKVQIDDGDAQSLPLTADAIKPGKHHLKFSGPSGKTFKPKEMDVSVDEGATRNVDDVKLDLASVNMKFTLPIKGTRATLSDGTSKVDLKDDGKPVVLDPTKSYTINATAPGYEDLKDSPLKLGDDADQSFAVQLVEKGKPTPPVATTTTPPVTPPATTTKPTTTTPPVTPPPVVASGDDGTLFINTLPKSNCVVNGTPRGATPITIKVPAGNYNVTCVTKDGDEVLKKSSAAQVVAGQKATVVLKLRD